MEVQPIRLEDFTKFTHVLETDIIVDPSYKRENLDTVARIQREIDEFIGGESNREIVDGQPLEVQWKRYTNHFAIYGCESIYADAILLKHTDLLFKSLRHCINSIFPQVIADQKVVIAYFLTKPLAINHDGLA